MCIPARLLPTPAAGLDMASCCAPAEITHSAGTQDVTQPKRATINPGSLGGPNQDELLLYEKLYPKTGQQLRRIEQCPERPTLLEELVRRADLGLNGDLRPGLFIQTSQSSSGGFHSLSSPPKVTTLVRPDWMASWCRAVPRFARMTGRTAPTPGPPASAARHCGFG